MSPTQFAIILTVLAWAVILSIFFYLCWVSAAPAERAPNGKLVASGAGRFMGWNTIYDIAGDGGPYMTRFWFGRLRLHIFHRGDLDEDCHDHPWDFWTFPLTPYVEEVVVREQYAEDDFEYHRVRQVVPAWKVTFRPATHCHRVLGAFSGRYVSPWTRTEYDPVESRGFIAGSEPAVDQSRKIVTLVWRSDNKRSWGFLKNREGKWCWIAWRDYVFNGGKEGPCQ